MKNLLDGRVYRLYPSRRMPSIRELPIKSRIDYQSLDEVITISTPVAPDNDQPLNSLPILKVAVASPLRTLFDYTVPKRLQSARFQPGQRVKVPFGNRHVVGLVAALAKESELPPDKLKSISDLLDDDPLLDHDLLSLYLWASDYYHFPVGLALQAGLPKPVREGGSLTAKTVTLWQPSESGHSLSLDSLKKAPRQQQVLALLKRHSPLSVEDINTRLDGSYSAILKAMADKDLVFSIQQLMETEHLAATPEPVLELNSEQQQAFDAIRNTTGTFQCNLLEGITGSGKTEVYLQLIAHCLTQGKQALVLIPEIGLTPQTLERFERRFGHPVTAIHSGLTETSRQSAWLDARSGKASIIIGTRSAIFLPLKNPGLIIIDEEHDSSFKQQDGFRYNARDLAIYRAWQLNIPVVLGSATPSLETLNNALTARYNHHLLQIRSGTSSLPDYRFVDLRGEPLEEGFSATLLGEIAYRLKQQQQVLVFLNRRGYSPMLMCHDCGWTAKCSRCDMAYTLHRHPPSLICHHCDKQTVLPATCPECSSSQLLPMGMGTERVEKVLKEHFGDYPVIRVDRDSTRGREAMQNIVESVNLNQPCILVGTQMLAKGHHFPGVTLVAILDVDRSLFSTSYRSQEQLGQLVTQVAGRAGRGEHGGEVFIQSHHVTHPLLRTLTEEGYGVLARQLLAERKTTNLPPFSHQALVHAEANQRDLPLNFLQDANAFLSAGNFKSFFALGPLPSPLEKKAGKFRFQLILQSATRKQLYLALKQLTAFLESHTHTRKVRWALDVDPLDFS